MLDLDLELQVYIKLVSGLCSNTQTQFDRVQVQVVLL